MSKRTVTERRRPPTMAERLTPCACCQFPLTHRHHILEFATHGETPLVCQLCPNCHELFHIAYRAYILHRDRAWTMWCSIVEILSENDRRIAWIKGHVIETQQTEFNHFVEQIEWDWDEREIIETLMET